MQLIRAVTKLLSRLGQCYLSYKFKLLMQAIEMVIEKGMNNGPFYNCVLTYLAMNASEAGGNCALLQTCFSHVNANSLAEVQLDLHNNSSKVFIKSILKSLVILAI